MKVKKVFNMKRFVFVEKRIYFAEIEYNCKTHTASEIAKAFKAKFPDEEAFSYEYDIIDVNKGICRLYREKCFDFVER